MTGMLHIESLDAEDNGGGGDGGARLVVRVLRRIGRMLQAFGIGNAASGCDVEGGGW